MDELRTDQSDDERLVRMALRAAYPPVRSSFSQRRGRQIVRAAALEQRDRRSVVGSRVAACVAASFTLLAGTTGAAGAALPGQALYPLKRIVERAMVAVSANKGDAARLELRFAERRMKEVRAVGIEKPVATSLTEKFNEHIKAAAALGGSELADEISRLRRSLDAEHADGTGDHDTTFERQGGRPTPSDSHTPVPGPAPSSTSTPRPSPSQTYAVPSSRPTGVPDIEPSTAPSERLQEVSLLHRSQRSVGGIDAS